MTLLMSRQVINHLDGRIIYDADDKKPKVLYYEFKITDHLGDLAVTFREADDGQLEVLQRHYYYPFGMNFHLQSPVMNTTTENRYQYNGKELEKDMGINLYDYGARWYDAAVGRWTSVDPLAEKYAGWSTYHYTMDNPVLLVDPDGREATDRIIEISKGNFKYVKDEFGTNSIAIIYLNGDIAYINKGKGAVLIKRQDVIRRQIEHRNAIARRRAFLKGLGDGLQNSGDIISDAGYGLALFTDGFSSLAVAVGETSSFVGKVITNSVKIEEEGFTHKNVKDAATDFLFELAPAPVNRVIKRSNLDGTTKRILKAEVGKVKQVTEFGVKKTRKEKSNNHGDGF